MTLCSNRTQCYHCCGITSYIDRMGQICLSSTIACDRLYICSVSMIRVVEHLGLNGVCIPDARVGMMVDGWVINTHAHLPTWTPGVPGAITLRYWVHEAIAIGSMGNRNVPQTWASNVFVGLAWHAISSKTSVAWTEIIPSTGILCAGKHEEWLQSSCHNAYHVPVQMGQIDLSGNIT